MTESDIQALNQCAVGESVTLSDKRKIERIEDGDCADCPFFDECGEETEVGKACGDVGRFVEVRDE